MIRPPGIDNGAFVVSPATVWYARVTVLLLLSASAIIELWVFRQAARADISLNEQTLDLSPSTARWSRHLKHTTILRMVIISFMFIIPLMYGNFLLSPSVTQGRFSTT